MNSRVCINLCRMLWSDLLLMGAGMLIRTGERIVKHSTIVAIKARTERETWWHAGYTWKNGKLVRR